ncbi:M42 family metallopeptidase [Irregularibacter muris]|uniref:M42 family metallopeptidase n=1 Tax=Irregularibacter muris TaxID=1796619 RepID=A0AAE3HIF1_9FIRM|nr:M42 family metallopeptidase [Irregularibacter muris]MCR1899509.1 M42 family metallopeptidase [Irregularibacter muris]
MNNVKKYIDYSIAQIVNLCTTPSPTGFTRKAEKYLIEELSRMGYQPMSTTKGSVLVELGGQGDGLVLAAHIDTLGAMVRSIKSNGRLRLTKIGGFPENNIEGENCIIHTRKDKEYSATIQLTNASVHVYSDVGELKRDDSTVEVVIDEKVASKEEVMELGIRVGDFISFDPRTIVTERGYIKSRHLDDKASAGILLALAKMIKEENIPLNRKIYLLFTTYEEVGHGGAAGVPQDITEMISVDMGAVGDDLETDEHKVSICAKDSGGPYDYDVTTRLIDIAQEQKLNYAVDIYPRYGSDVEATLSAGFDIKHGLLGPGVYASHGYERTHREGIENTFALLVNYIHLLG